MAKYQVQSLFEDSKVFATHNDLIEKFSLNLLSEREEDILMIIVSDLQQNREFTKISLKEIKNLLDKTMTYKQLISEVEQLSKKSLVLLSEEIYNADGSLAAENGDMWLPIIFSSLIIHKREKAVSVKFNSDIQYIFWDLKDKFSIGNVQDYLKLNGKKQKILYRFFKRWENYNVSESINISVDRLKKLLKCSETYQYKSLKKVLNSAVENINKQSDISVEFYENKKSKKVISIDFKISNIKKEIRNDLFEKKNRKAKLENVVDGEKELMDLYQENS